MTRAGMPTAVERGGMSVTTTALAPMRLSWPIVTAPSTQTPQPMSTRSPMIGMVPAADGDAERGVLADVDVVADRSGVEHHPAVVPDPHPAPRRTV